MQTKYDSPFDRCFGVFGFLGHIAMNEASTTGQAIQTGELVGLRRDDGDEDDDFVLDLLRTGMAEEVLPNKGRYPQSHRR